jgi:hypothetical protein
MRQLNMNRHLDINFVLILGFIHLNQTLLCRFVLSALAAKSLFQQTRSPINSTRIVLSVNIDTIDEQVCTLKTAAMGFQLLASSTLPKTQSKPNNAR